ncbi:hypothetical protein MZE11_19535, partial [Bacillus amyloliquefaciens]|nr:hypothetical protein [Bacillus amyloliquefaciens]
RFDLNIDTLKLLSPLLELASCSIGLLQVNDKHFNLTLQTRFLLLNIVDLNNKSFDLFFLLLDTS